MPPVTTLLSFGEKISDEAASYGHRETSFICNVLFLIGKRDEIR
jgi:hypothetical protein